MPDPQSAVTDTHPLIFHAAGGGLLGPRAAAFFGRCERREAILYVPAAVIWECSLLARVGGVNPANRPHVLDDLSAIRIPAARSPRSRCFCRRARFTRPFDALIVAAAQTGGLTLVTRDNAIRESGAVGVIW